MKIRTTKTIEEFIDVNLPYYSKSICFAYKVISEELVIVVEYDGTCRGISTCRIGGTHALNHDVPEITEEEFWMLYNETKKQLHDAAISG